MSLAWTTVAFLVLLLPGFLFIVALYGQIPREIGLKSPLAQLAASVLVSLFIHGGYYALVDPIISYHYSKSFRTPQYSSMKWLIAFQLIDAIFSHI